MKLYSGKIPVIAEDIIRSLTEAGDVEVEADEEARLDIEAVLKEYVRLDREIVDEAKNRMESRGLGYSHLGKMKAQVAKERAAPQSDEILPYLIDQILNMLFHSNHIEEIYADDVELRKKLTPILRKHMEVESELDKEVRSKIKNLQEGTATFEIEYSRVMDQIKRKRGLS
ncbi:MAG: DUF507 family protein [Myxococcota bacterium]